MPLQQHVEIDTRPATRYTSQGDAAVWLAYSLAGTAVLRFTDLSGEPIEIELGHTELAAVAATARAIYNASDDDKTTWLRHAAELARIAATKGV